MAKFITITAFRTNGQTPKKLEDYETQVIDVNFDLVYQYGFLTSGVCTWVELPDAEVLYVSETPEQIRAMLNGQRVGTAIQAPWTKAGVVTPMRYTFDGIEVSEQEIVDALQMARNVLFKG